MCPICQGARTIRLPVREQLSSISFESEIIPKSDNAYMTYDCPECTAKQAAEEQVQFFYAECVSDELAPFKITHEDLSHALASHLLEKDLIDFSVETRPDDLGLRTLKVVRARIGVVSKRKAENIESKIFNSGIKTAEDVAYLARKKIRDFSSGYGEDVRITKSVALWLIYESLREVSKRGPVPETCHE